MPESDVHPPSRPKAMAGKAATKDRRRAIVRTVVVIALAIYTIARVAPQIAYYWLPKGNFGIWAEYDGVIEKIDPGSAAADAGLNVGDRIEMQRHNLHERLTLIGWGQPGETVRAHILHNGQERIVTLVAHTDSPGQHIGTGINLQYESGADIKVALLEIGMLLRVLLGATLVLLQPARLTWLFYLWMISLGQSSDFYFGPGGLLILALAPFAALSGAACFTTVLFCLVFPNDELTSWRRRVFPFIVVAAGIAAAIGLAQFAGIIFNFDMTTNVWIPDVEAIVGAALGSAALLTYYVQANRLDRVRVRWIILVVITGWGLGLASDLFVLVHSSEPAALAPPILDLGWYWWVLIPLVFAYAIIRYRMFDVDFVLSRTLVYSVIVVGAIGIFSAIDLLFTSRFHGSRGELATDIAVALGLGFFVRALHGRMIDLVDRLLFRRRYDSRMRLKATLDSVATADSPNAIEQIVTSSAASALGLASAAFFRRVVDGGFLREISFGWPADALWHLLPDDKLVMALEKNRPSIDLYGLGWLRNVAAPPQAPVVVIPMHSGGTIIGVTFYGSRLNGVLPSPDELSGLVELARRAGITYRMLDSTRATVTARDLASTRISR